MAETTVKIRFIRSRGYKGEIIRQGAVIEVSEFWANVFLNDGTAVEVENAPKSEGRKAKGEGRKS